MTALKSAAGRKRADYVKELQERLGPGHLCALQAIGADTEQRRDYEVRESIAIVSISGVLVNDAQWWDETEYGDIQQEVAMATVDPEVRGILLAINSPGGETLNAFETADALIAAGREKPIWAVASPVAYSSGYLMAIAGARIYAPPVTGGVGSIGVYAEHWDWSEFLKQKGINITLISAGEGKTDGNPYEPLSKKAREAIEAEVMRLYGEFVGRVAKQRDRTVDAVEALGAKIYHGPEAVAQGLADRIGRLDDAWAAMAETVKESDSFSNMAASAVVKSNTQEGINMSEVLPKEADATLAPVVDTEAIQKKAYAHGRSDGYSAASEVVELCALAGKADLAPGFIKARKQPSDVRAALLDERAKEDEAANISSRVLPGDGANDQADDKKLEASQADRMKNLIAARGGR